MLGAAFCVLVDNGCNGVLVYNRKESKVRNFNFVYLHVVFSAYVSHNLYPFQLTYYYCCVLAVSYTLEALRPGNSF